MSALFCGICDSDAIVPCAGGPPSHTFARCESCGAVCAQEGPEPRDVSWFHPEPSIPAMNEDE